MTKTRGERVAVHRLRRMSARATDHLYGGDLSHRECKELHSHGVPGPVKQSLSRLARLPCQEEVNTPMPETKAGHSRYCSVVAFIAIATTIAACGMGPSINAQSSASTSTVGVTTTSGGTTSTTSAAPIWSDCTQDWLSSASLLGSINSSYGDTIQCINIPDENEVIVGVYGSAPPATQGDDSTYDGGVLVFSCGSTGCSNPPGGDELANWVLSSTRARASLAVSS